MPLEAFIKSQQDWNTITSIAKPFIGKHVFKVILDSEIIRTPEQNSYQHVLYQKIADFAKEIGNNWSIEDAKDFCKREFGYTETYKDLKGRTQTRLLSTRKYGKKRTADYITNIIAHFAQFGLVLPEPEAN